MNSEGGMSELMSCNPLALQNFVFSYCQEFLNNFVMPENVKIVPLPLAGRREPASEEDPANWCKLLFEPHALFVARHK